MFENFDWTYIWSLVREILIPHTGTLIWNVILFLFLGFSLGILYLFILHKKGVLKREQQYYNWAVKLYIPLILIGFIYLFGQIGFIKGSFKILSKEKEHIVTQIYDYSMGEAFDSEENKKDFITKLQHLTKETQKGASSMVKVLSFAAMQYNTGIEIVDLGKNKLSIYLLKKYGDDIYSAVIYGLLNIGASHANIHEIVSYKEFNDAFNFLLSVDSAQIEKSIKSQLTSWVNQLFISQYNSLLKSISIMILIVSLLPLIEFFIYKKWIINRYK